MLGADGDVADVGLHQVCSEQSRQARLLQRTEMSANVVFIKAWTDAATEHIEVRSMFTAGAPYVTIYIDGPIQCSDHRILHNLYYAGGERRTAQTFVCSFPSGESIDVVNVHVPSGYWPLKDPPTQDTTNDSATEQFANRA